MDIDGVIDRLERAYADAGLPPIRQADGAMHSVVDLIAAEIAPLELPAELVRFWSRIDPHSLAGAPYPRPTDPSFALDTWLSHRDETPGMVPRLLFPVCYESWGFVLVELHDDGELGGACFEWAYAGSPFRLRFASWAGYLELLASLVEAGHMQSDDRQGQPVITLADGVWEEARASQLAASLPHPVYKERLELPEDVRLWPEHWVRASGLDDVRELRGATTTIAQLLAAVAEGRDTRGTIHAHVVGLSGTAAGSRATIDDGTGRIDVWCPAAVCGYGPIMNREFEFDLAARPGTAPPTIDTTTEHRETQQRALSGDLVGAQHAARELLARLHAPTMATADAVRPLD